MSFSIKQQEDGTWSVLAPNGQRVLEGETYQVADNVATACNAGGLGIDEAAEVARGIIGDPSETDNRSSRH